MKKVFEVQAYYSGWYTLVFFSSKKKALAYMAKQESISKKTPRLGLMSFQVVEQRVL